MTVTLPPELLQLIVNNASPSVLKVLRRVSKTLHMAASRRLFTTLTVDDEHSALLACLAAHDSHLAPAFDTLELRSLSKGKGRRSFLRRVIQIPCSSRRSALDNFLIVLRDLEQVSSVSIDVKAFGRMPVDVCATTIQALGALPSLSHLKLDLRDGDARHITSLAHTFHNLQSLHIVGGAAHYSTLSTIVKNSPHLTSLTVHARDRSVPADALSKLLPTTTCIIHTLDVDAALAPCLSSSTIPSSLQSLTIGGQEPVWDSLRSSQIKLHTLRTSSPSPALMSYLLSFTGLRCLTIDAPDADADCCSSEDENEPSFAQFWADVLSTHAATLERLEVAGCIIRSADIPTIPVCPRIRSMSLCIDGRDSSDNVPATLFDAIDHGLFPRLRSLSMIMYSHPAGGDAGLVRAHHALQDLVAQYECTAPSEYLRALRVNTGHMKDSLIMKDELDSRWCFQFA